MANSFGTDILIQTPDRAQAAAFYAEGIGFTITDPNPGMIALAGPNINLYIEQGPPLGPVFEVTVPDVEEAMGRLVEQGCTVIKHEPGFPRTYIRDPFGLIYNLAQQPETAG